MHELASLEDHLVQNPFTAVGHVKPSRFRRLTLVVVLFYLDYATRHIFNRGNLAGVKTIHFARWVLIDDKRRVFFASNYDGSLESLHGRLHRQGRLGPQPRLHERRRLPEDALARRSAARADELAFKDFLRLHQAPTHVWYSAYGGLTALNIEQNARIRAGLHGDLDADDERDWVQSL